MLRPWQHSEGPNIEGAVDAAECGLSQTQNPDRAPGGADSCAAFKIFLSQVAAISCFSVNEGPLSEPLSEPQRCPKWVHEGPHPTHPLRVGGGRSSPPCASAYVVPGGSESARVFVMRSILEAVLVGPF